MKFEIKDGVLIKAYDNGEDEVTVHDPNFYVFGS